MVEERCSWPLLMSLWQFPRFSATQYALLSGVYALSESILRRSWLAEQVGWPSFFLFTAWRPWPAFSLADAATHPLEGQRRDRRV